MMGTGVQDPSILTSFHVFWGQSDPFVSSISARRELWQSQFPVSESCKTKDLCCVQRPFSFFPSFFFSFKGWGLIENKSRSNS